MRRKAIEGYLAVARNVVRVLVPMAFFATAALQGAPAGAPPAAANCGAQPAHVTGDGVCRS
jgi:hypothetical protein